MLLSELMIDHQNRYPCNAESFDHLLIIIIITSVKVFVVATSNWIISAIKINPLFIDKHIADYELGIRSFDREPSEYKCQWCNYFLEDCQHNIDPIQAETITSLMIPEDIDINEDFYNIV